MEYLKIRNWDKWQSYRNDRGQPPWIKIHRCIMRNPEWVSLTDSERGQLVSIWLLAADHDGVIPASPDVIKKLCYMTDELNINKFIELDFICQPDAKLTSICQPDVTPETEKDTEEEIEKEKNICPHQDILNLWSSILPELIQPQKWDDDDKKLLKMRWMTSKNTQKIEWWESWFKYIRESPFLMGDIEPKNGNQRFKLRLQWALNKTNFKKINDGVYHNG